MYNNKPKTTFTYSQNASLNSSLNSSMANPKTSSQIYPKFNYKFDQSSVVKTPVKVQSPMKTQDQTQAHSAQCFLVNCMDFRLIDDMVYFMNKLGYNNNYDQFTLAGASLGFTQDKYPHWGQSLLDHMSIGQNLHSFKEIMFIDHVDCGAYKKFYPEYKKDPQMYHKKHIQLAYDKLSVVFPEFNFTAYIMDLSGACRKIHINEHSKIKKEDVKKDEFLSNLELSQQVHHAPHH